MTALVPIRGLAESLADLFAPVDPAPAVALLAEYRSQRSLLERVASIFADDKTRTCLRYFLDGNADDQRYTSGYVAETLFKLDGAVDALNAAYWAKLMESSDILDTMPQKRRTAWHDMIQSYGMQAPSTVDEYGEEVKGAWTRIPDFTEETIKGTFAELIASRHKFFAERVDGIFSDLSPEHKTNLPSGFRSKLILNYVFDGYGFASSQRVGTLSDLRVVVARFMGRDDVGEGGHTVRMLTSRLVEYARNERRGEWVTVDGGAIEIKGHKCGTMHVRVHDEIAWRLNAVLAYLHPGAIPESARTRPKRGSTKAAPKVELVTRPLPFAVLQALAEFNENKDTRRGQVDGTNWYRHYDRTNTRVWHYGHGWTELDKHVRSEVTQVLKSLGGAVVDPSDRWSMGMFAFEYNVASALREIIASGCVPDAKAHQYYPTPPHIAQRAVDLACIGADDRVLEPSAGQGALACLLPADRTTCIEVSALHCAVLRAKGLDVVEGDALTVTPSDIGEHDVVVMNPPYDRGQWRAHVEHAAGFLLGPGARLVAVLPASAPSASILPGWNLTWSEPMEFAGTSIRVVILVAVREP